MNVIVLAIELFQSHPEVGANSFAGCANVSDQKVVASLADLGVCDTVTLGPSNSDSVENLSGYDAAAEFPRSDWAVCR